MPDHPKVVVVGPPGSGKSTLVASVSGIYLGTTTTCPVEWHLSPSATWAATVSVAYHCPNFSSQSLVMDTTVPQKVEIVCSTPRQLQLLLKMAELMMFYPGIREASVSSLSEDAVNAALESNRSKSLSGGVIYVDLQCPQQISQEITVVDMPSIAREESDNPLSVIFVKQLLRSYTQSERTLIAVILPITDVGSKHHSQVLSFVKSIDGRLIRTTGESLTAHCKVGTNVNSSICFIYAVLLNHLEASTHFATLLPKLLRPYQCFYTHQPDQPVPFAYLSPGIQHLRQDEVAFFHFSRPWSSQVERRNLGVSNILKAWSVLHCQLSSSQRTHHPRRGFMTTWTFCVWILLSVVVGLLWINVTLARFGSSDSGLLLIN